METEVKQRQVFDFTGKSEESGANRRAGNPLFMERAENRVFSLRGSGGYRGAGWKMTGLLNGVKTKSTV